MYYKMLILMLILVYDGIYFMAFKFMLNSFSKYKFVRKKMLGASFQSGHENSMDT